MTWFGAAGYLALRVGAWPLALVAGQAWCARLKTFAPHPRIVAAARDAGLDAIETPPGDAGLLTALLEWFTQHPVPPSSP